VIPVLESAQKSLKSGKIFNIDVICVCIC